MAENGRHMMPMNQRNAYPFLSKTPSVFMERELERDERRLSLSAIKEKTSRKRLPIADTAGTDGLDPNEAYREILRSMVDRTFEAQDMVGKEIVVKESTSIPGDLPEPPSVLTKKSNYKGFNKRDSVRLSSIDKKEGRHSDNDDISLANTSVSSITTKGSAMSDLCFASTTHVTIMQKSPPQGGDQLSFGWVREKFLYFFCDACSLDEEKRMSH
jgi:hypothetical protein